MKNDLKIKKSSASDLVCERIKELIANGTWTYSQKIPSEGELAEAFGVNRLTVRIALQRLNALGILDTRVGDGTYVCHFNFGNHIENISAFYMTPKLLDDVAEFRLVFEIECARLAIQKHTAEDLKELEKCCVRFETVSLEYFKLRETDDPQSERLHTAYNELNLADLAFHSQVCIMSHNDLLSYAFAVAKPVILEYMATLSDARLPSIASYEWSCGAKGHWDIYNAIANKDFDTCKKLYQAMIDPSNTMPYFDSVGKG